MLASCPDRLRLEGQTCELRERLGTLTGGDAVGVRVGVERVDKVDEVGGHVAASVDIENVRGMEL